MDPLVRSLTETLQVHFGARLVNTIWSQHSNHDPIHIMGQYQAVAYNHTPTTELELTVHEVGTCLFSNAIRTGLFDEIMGTSGKLIHCESMMDHLGNFGSTKRMTTKVKIIVADAEKLIEDIEKYSWTRYDKEFDALIKETLTDKV